MLFDWCLLQDYDIWCDGLVILVPIKQKSSNRKAQYGTSYPTHLTRLEEQMKTLPYPPYIGVALKLWTCRLFTRTTCSLLLPGFELDMTFRPYKVCSFHSDIKTSLQLRSMGWILANLSVTDTIGPLPLWRCRPPVRVFCTIWIGIQWCRYRSLQGLK